MNLDIIDSGDYQSLLVAILEQTINDYIKLQHPSTRTEKYLQEHYLNALDFLFDDDYRLANLKNGFNEDMSLVDLISEIMDTDRPNIQTLRNYVVSECNKYWREKKMSVLDHIPDTICVDGQTYNIAHSPDNGYTLDMRNKTITLNKELTQDNQIILIKAILDISLQGKEAISLDSLGERARDALANSIYTTLKVNNCFSYIKSNG